MWLWLLLSQTRQQHAWTAATCVSHFNTKSIIDYTRYLALCLSACIPDALSVSLHLTTRLFSLSLSLSPSSQSVFVLAEISWTTHQSTLRVPSASWLPLPSAAPLRRHMLVSLPLSACVCETSFNYGLLNAQILPSLKKLAICPWLFKSSNSNSGCECEGGLISCQAGSE